MSAAENKAIARRFLEEAWNNRNVDAIDEILASNYVDHNSPPGVAPDRAGAKQWARLVLAAFPDTHFTIEDQMAEGDKVVMRWTARGTQRGAFMGVAPTNKPVTVTGMNINRIAGGKIVEGWGNWDQLGLLQQLGMVPVPEPAGR